MGLKIFPQLEIGNTKNQAEAPLIDCLSFGEAYRSSARRSKRLSFPETERANQEKSASQPACWRSGNQKRGPKDPPKQQAESNQPINFGL